MVEEEFKDRINWMTGSWMPARSIVQAAIDERKESELIIFGSGGLPWKEHLFQIEKELKIEGHIKYAVYKNKETDWRIQVRIIFYILSTSVNTEIDSKCF